MKTVGIIGGMGPEATLDLFSKIIRNTPAQKDQDHLHIIIDNYPAIPDRTAYVIGEGKDPAPFLIESAKRLAKSNVDIMCMPCNTAHYFLKTICKEIKTPFVSIIESTFRTVKLVAPNTKKIGLLATKGTLQGRVYHNIFEQFGMEFIDIPESVRNDVMQAIYSVKAGEGNKNIDLLKNAINYLEDAGADVIIGGCTEIPLLFPYCTSEIPLIDPTLALAEAVVDAALA